MQTAFKYINCTPILELLTDPLLWWWHSYACRNNLEFTDSTTDHWLSVDHWDRISKSNFHCADKMSSQIKLRMKMFRKGDKAQKKCVKISKIRLKEVTFTVLRSKAGFCAVCGKFGANMRLCVCNPFPLNIPTPQETQILINLLST